MARVRDIEIDEVPDDLRGVYQRFATDYGPFLNQVKVFAHRRLVEQGLDIETVSNILEPDCPGLDEPVAASGGD